MPNLNPDQRGLTPIRRGQVLNPTGRNQYTYRAEAEKSLDNWCREYADAVIERCCRDAAAGQSWAMKLLLDRILPAKHAVAVSTDHENAAEGLIEALSQAKEEMERREASGVNVGE